MENLTYSVPNILVVDDINANLVLLTEVIRNAGYIARPVTGARQAMSAIDTLAPHLILLDISMPEMDGFEFCALLKKNSNTRDIPIIFISAFNSTEDKIRGFKLGAIDYISKPFEVEEVTLRVNTHLKIYRMQQELEVYNKKLYKIINDQISKIYEEQKNILETLVKLSSKRNSFIGGHQERVARNSRLLAMSLQLSPLYEDVITNNFISSIELAAMMHDIGKIGIPDYIMISEELTPEEAELLATHTTLGGNTLKQIYSFNDHNEFIKMAIDITFHHHENWDGSGYPAGLKGYDIPLSARIVAIANSFDLVGKSISRLEPNPMEKAVKYIEENAGILFDAQIVSVFLKIQKQLEFNPALIHNSHNKIQELSG